MRYRTKTNSGEQQAPPYYSWRLRIWANPGGTLEAACQNAGFEQVEQEDNEEEEE